ncbi:hypothetical protein AB0K15_43260 [Amycolatopsis sp. NPDC049253]|uniref:hypothetical protein n=1 Tax=Amycolatopsis sp. NPDC049253 TaxID=3155274 RepID=UPI003432C88D
MSDEATTPHEPSVVERAAPVFVEAADAGLLSAARPRSRGEDDLAVRMVNLAYRVTVSTGCSRRTRARVWRSVSTVVASRSAAGAPNEDERIRGLVLAAVHGELAAGTARDRLLAALEEALLLDEVALLPPRQCFTLWSAAVERRSVAEVAALAGWTPAQVALLLRAALRTVARSGYGQALAEGTI